jgi:hypothetical protein
MKTRHGNTKEKNNYNGTPRYKNLLLNKYVFSIVDFTYYCITTLYQRSKFQNCIQITCHEINININMDIRIRHSALKLI